MTWFTCIIQITIVESTRSFTLRARISEYMREARKILKRLQTTDNARPLVEHTFSATCPLDRAQVLKPDDDNQVNSASYLLRNNWMMSNYTGHMNLCETSNIYFAISQKTF